MKLLSELALKTLFDAMGVMGDVDLVVMLGRISNRAAHKRSLDQGQRHLDLPVARGKRRGIAIAKKYCLCHYCHLQATLTKTLMVYLFI